jgi:hypothetical protein
MGDEQPTSESGPLADWFQWVEPDVVPQEEKPAGPESDPDDTSADLTPRAWPPRDEQLAELAVLAPWVNRLQKEYAAAGDWLVPCWWRHRFAINELAALRIAWMGTSTSKKAEAELTWHESAEKCRVRIRQAIGDGAGCTATKHHPDWPVTRDERWKDENKELRGILPDDAEQLRTTAAHSDSEASSQGPGHEKGTP